LNECHLLKQGDGLGYHKVAFPEEVAGRILKDTHPRTSVNLLE
jgi:hypothetical protein